MNRLLAVIVIVCLLTPSASAWPRVVSYNPSYGQTVKVLYEWIAGGFGFNVTSKIEYTRNDGCLQVWQQNYRTTWSGLERVGEPVLLKEICP